jgi:hypothetical protein
LNLHPKSPSFIRLDSPTNHSDINFEDIILELEENNSLDGSEINSTDSPNLVSIQQTE